MGGEIGRKEMEESEGRRNDFLPEFSPPTYLFLSVKLYLTLFTLEAYMSLNSIVNFLPSGNVSPSILMSSSTFPWV